MLLLFCGYDRPYFFRFFYSHVLIASLFITLSLLYVKIIGKWVGPSALDFKIKNALCGLIW